MEEIGKRRLAVALVAAAGLAYFLAFALPLPMELVLSPSWARSLEGAQAASDPARDAGDAAIPFRLGGRFGYFTPDGRLLFAAKAPYGLALAVGEWASFEKNSTSFVTRSPDGTELARVDIVGYPFFAAGRRFVIGPDQASVAEIGEDGAASWSYRFSSVATAFGAGSVVAAFGLMDGTIIGFDRAGAAILRFAPGGSRIPGIYGVAVSPDGSLVAAVAGLDRQRLVILEKRSSDYRVTYHRWLDSDYRRPVSIAFTEDGRKLVYESPAGTGVWDRDSHSESTIAASLRSGAGLSARKASLLTFLVGRGDETRLLCAAPPDRRAVDAALPPGSALIAVDEDAIYLAADSRIFRMDLEER